MDFTKYKREKKVQTEDKKKKYVTTVAVVCLEL